MKNPSLSIVVPSYNEEKNIPYVVDGYEKFRKKYNFELIYVNNGSTDTTAKVLSGLSKKNKHNFLKIVTVKKNIGYGHGVMSGLLNSNADIISWTHADSQTPPKDVFKAYDLYKKINNSKLVIKGKRKGRPITDMFISKCMGIVASFFLQIRISEINAQPKLFNRDLLKELKGAPNDFSLDLFFLYKAKKMSYEIVTIDVDFLKRKHGKSKWSYSFSGKLNMIVNTLKYIRYLSKNS